MSLETATYISQLNGANPTGTDPKSEGDDHLRMIKNVLKTQFPNFGTNAFAVYADASGNIGVGVAPIGVRVDVQGPAGVGFRYNDGTVSAVMGTQSGRAIVGSTTNNAVSVLTNNVETARFQGLGLTIGGAANPNARLDLRGVNATDNWVVMSDGGGNLYGAFGIPPAGGKFSIQTVVPLAFVTAGIERAQIDASGVFTYGGLEVGFRDIPRVTGGVEPGKVFATSAGVTINAAPRAGVAYAIYNDSASPITLTQGTANLRLAGTATAGNRTVAARGYATIWFNSTTEGVVMGPGVT